MFLSMKAKKAFSTTLVDILPQIGTEVRVVGLKKDSFLTKFSLINDNIIK